VLEVIVILLFLFAVGFQAVELNSIVADVFKTAYLRRRYNNWENRTSDLQHTSGAMSQLGAPDASGLPHTHHHPCSFGCQSGETSLRPQSAISASSSSDSAADVNCSVMGEGLGSVSSITESVNSWSFRFPGIPAVDSVADSGAEEKLTLLIDNRRRSQIVANSVGDTSTNSQVWMLFLWLPYF